MDSVNKTLYIPLYGKALVSRQGRILRDEKAEQIWDSRGFPLKRKARSKWLAYHMGMRARVFDDWTRQKLAEYPDAAVLHLGCGLDSRVLRLDARNRCWYDVDFPEVIRERHLFYRTGFLPGMGADPGPFDPGTAGPGTGLLPLDVCRKPCTADLLSV